MKSQNKKPSSKRATPSKPHTATTASAQGQAATHLESPTPLRVEFEDADEHLGALKTVEASLRVWDGHIVLSARAGDWRVPGVYADLKSLDARAIALRLSRAQTARRQLSGGYADIVRLPENHRWPGDTFEVRFDSTFQSHITSGVRLLFDKIVLVLQGGNARVRLYLNSTQADALIHDLEAAITASREFSSHT